MFLRDFSACTAGINLQTGGSTVNSIKKYMQLHFVEAILMYLLFV